jgi:uncharacterized protein (TIGR02996 family)
MARNPDLEARVVAAPDDPGVWRVYGDWLQGQGDPRGELIGLQLQEEDEVDRRDRTRLVSRRRRLMRQHFHELLGPLAEVRQFFQPVLRRGFLTQLSLFVGNSSRARGRSVELLASILDHECSRFLRHVRLEVTWWGTSGLALQELSRAAVILGASQRPLFDSVDLVGKTWEAVAGTASLRRVSTAETAAAIAPVLPRLRHQRSYSQTSREGPEGEDFRHLHDGHERARSDGTTQRK